MVSSDARMVRLEPKESLARYASTGFSSRGRSAARIAGGASMAGGDDTPSPEEKSWPIRAAIVASGSCSATLRPPILFGSEKDNSQQSVSSILYNPVEVGEKSSYNPHDDSGQSKREVECPCLSGVDDSGCQFHDPVAKAYTPDGQICPRYQTRRDVDSPTLPATAQEDSVNHHVLSQPL